MRYETRVEMIGEELGPVDWSHPWIAEMEGDRFKAGRLSAIREFASLPEDDRDGWLATDDGGIPRCGISPVLRIAMYDGWPYWEPHPVVVIELWQGIKRIPFNNITEFYRRIP